MEEFKESSIVKLLEAQSTLSVLSKNYYSYSSYKQVFKPKNFGNLLGELSAAVFGPVVLGWIAYSISNKLSTHHNFLYSSIAALVGFLLYLFVNYIAAKEQVQYHNKVRKTVEESRTLTNLVKDYSKGDSYDRELLELIYKAYRRRKISEDNFYKLEERQQVFEERKADYESKYGGLIPKEYEGRKS